MALFRKKTEVDEAEQEKFAHEVRVAQAVMRRYPASTKVSFGAPTKCPDCGQYGFVVNVNHALAMCANRCLACGMEWTLTRRALAHAAASVLPDLIEVPRLALSPDPVVEVADDAGDMIDLDHPPSWFSDPAPAPRPAGPPAPTWHRDSELLAAALAPPELVRTAPAETAPEPVPPTAPPVPAAEASEAPPMTPPLRVLMIEDNVFDFMLLESLLEPVRGSVEVLHAATLGEGYRLYHAGIDAVLLDLSLPDSDGVSTLMEWLHRTPRSAPVIVLSGHGDATLIAECRSLGAPHYIQKQHLAALSEDPKGAATFVALLQATVLKHRAQQLPV